MGIVHSEDHIPSPQFDTIVIIEVFRSRYSFVFFVNERIVLNLDTSTDILTCSNHRGFAFMNNWEMAMSPMESATQSKPSFVQIVVHPM